MSDDEQRHDEQQEDLDLTELTEEDNDSEHRSGDEIYQETRRDAGGVDTIDKDISTPDEISVSSTPDKSFSEREEELRQFWRTRYAGRGKGFEYYRPALKYGYELSYSDDYDSDDWNGFEEDIRDKWENTNPDTWDEMEPLIKHGWNMGYQFQEDIEIDNPMIEQGTSQQDAAIDDAEGDSADDTGADQPENEHGHESEEENA